MSTVLATALGLPYEMAILITTVVATIGTFGAMAAIVFLAWAPHLSGSWAEQLGVGLGDTEDEPTAGAD